MQGNSYGSPPEKFIIELTPFTTNPSAVKEPPVAASVINMFIPLRLGSPRMPGGPPIFVNPIAEQLASDKTTPAATVFPTTARSYAAIAAELESLTDAASYVTSDID